MGEIKGINPFQPKPIGPEINKPKVQPKPLGGPEDLGPARIIDTGDKVDLEKLPAIGKDDLPKSAPEPSNLVKPNELVKEREHIPSVPKFLTMEEELPTLGGVKDLPRPFANLVPAGPKAIPRSIGDILLTPQRGNISGFWANFKVG